MSTSIRQFRGRSRARAARWLVKDYDSGLTLRQVAEKNGLSVGGTRRLLIEGGVVWRTGSDARRKRVR